MLIGYSLARLHASKGTWLKCERKKSRISLVPHRTRKFSCIMSTLCIYIYVRCVMCVWVRAQTVTYLQSASRLLLLIHCSYSLFFSLNLVAYITFSFGSRFIRSFCLILFNAATRYIYTHTHTKCGAGTVVTIIYEIAKTYTLTGANIAHAIRLRVVSQAGRHSFIHLISDGKLLL